MQEDYAGRLELGLALAQGLAVDALRDDPHVWRGFFLRRTSSTSLSILQLGKRPNLRPGTLLLVPSWFDGDMALLTALEDVDVLDVNEGVSHAGDYMSGHLSLTVFVAIVKFQRLAPPWDASPQRPTTFSADRVVPAVEAALVVVA